MARVDVRYDCLLDSLATTTSLFMRLERADRKTRYIIRSAKWFTSSSWQQGRRWWNTRTHRKCRSCSQPASWCSSSEAYGVECVDWKKKDNHPKNPKCGLTIWCKITVTWARNPWQATTRWKKTQNYTPHPAQRRRQQWRWRAWRCWQRTELQRQSSSQQLWPTRCRNRTTSQRQWCWS